jgi:hypothetical protein
MVQKILVIKANLNTLQLAPSIELDQDDQDQIEVDENESDVEE